MTSVCEKTKAPDCLAAANRLATSAGRFSVIPESMPCVDGKYVQVLRIVKYRHDMCLWRLENEAVELSCRFTEEVVRLQEVACAWRRKETFK